MKMMWGPGSKYDYTAQAAVFFQDFAFTSMVPEHAFVGAEGSASFSGVKHNYKYW